MLIPKTRNDGHAVPSATILDHASVAAKRGTIRLVSSSSVEGRRQSPSGDIGDGVREPEIVDLAAPTPLRSWTRRPPARHAPPPPPVPPERMPSWRKRGVPDTASRQSEMSFGVLDYYIHGAESKSPEMQSNPGATTIRAVAPARDRFDFGLDGAKRERTPPPRRREVDVRSGAEQSEEEEMRLVPLSPRPFNEEEEKHVVFSHPNQPVEIQHQKTYSLFPAVKDTKPSTVNRLVQVYNTPAGFETPGIRAKPTGHHYPPPKLLPGAEINSNNPASKTPSTTRHRCETTTTFPSPTTITSIPGTSPPTTLSSPTYNPKPPFPNSTTRLIPLRILSTSSTSTTHTSLTATTTSRSSTSTSNSPSSSSTSTQKPLLSGASHGSRGSHSRWSEDTTLARPTTAAAVLCGGAGRSSWGSLLGGSSPGLGGVGGGVYPDCFFEDDEEEGWVAGTGRRGRRGRRKGRWGWRGWVCCGRV